MKTETNFPTDTVEKTQTVQTVMGVLCMHILCSSRKYPYPPHGILLEKPRRRGFLKAKVLEAKYEAKLEFLSGERGYFLELHIGA